MTNLPDIPLPSGIRSRFVEGINGLRLHVLEAGYQTRGRPCVLLLHGFPELAYSWRKVMPVFAEAGYHVIAPDQRGYGRSTGWDANYNGDLGSFRLLNLVRPAGCSMRGRIDIAGRDRRPSAIDPAPAGFAGRGTEAPSPATKSTAPPKARRNIYSASHGASC